jgi:hypothetical protein
MSAVAGPEEEAFTVTARDLRSVLTTTVKRMRLHDAGLECSALIYSTFTNTKHERDVIITSFYLPVRVVMYKS